MYFVIAGGWKSQKHDEGVNSREALIPYRLAALVLAQSLTDLLRDRYPGWRKTGLMDTFFLELLACCWRHEVGALCAAAVDVAQTPWAMIIACSFPTFGPLRFARVATRF
jgi:hypothetical protein